MERLTKRIAIVSAIAALSLLVHLISRGYPPMVKMAVTAFVGSGALSLVAGDLAMSVILFLVCLVPVLFLTLAGVSNIWDFVPWMAAVLGFLVPQSLRTGWSFPSRWKAPLMLWTLSVALSWPIIVAREVDFTPAVLNRSDVWSSRAGVAPPFAATWTVSVAAITVIGLLWLDWLFAAYSKERRRQFERRVVWPLFAGALVAAASAVSQSLGFVTFLNATLYGSLGRAAGTMLDANAFGAVAAIWVPIAAALALRSDSRRPWLPLAWAIVLVVLGISVWSTGSRTALLAALVGVAIFSRVSWRSSSANRIKVLIIAGTLAMLTAAVVFLGATSATVMGRRIQLLVPDLSARTLGHALYELWDRNRYGAAALRMIADHPLVGVGVGGFHIQVADAAYVSGYDGLKSDNAQNWFRHQLAEMGILGSVGWLAFSATFMWLLFRRRGPDEERSLAGAVKGAVVGVGVASLLGMPTQNPAVLFTFLALVFWWLRLTEAPAAEGTPRLGARQWIFVVGVAGCFLAGTAYAGWTELRPPYRAMRADWKYQYGFHDDPQHAELRWTEKKAVDVFPIDQPNEYRWLKLVIGAVAPDADQRPVVVNVWRDHELILRLTRRSDVQKTWYVGVPKGRRMMMVQIEVSRSWRAVDYGRRGDPWERGVAVGKWTFAYDPPKGETLIPARSVSEKP